MITIDCPFCAGHAETDHDLTTLRCDGCGVTIEVAPDAALELEVAA